MELLLMILGCRRSTLGERLLLAALIRCGMALGSVVLLINGYFIPSPDTEYHRFMGYLLLFASLLFPILKRALHAFIDERF